MFYNFSNLNLWKRYVRTTVDQTDHLPPFIILVHQLIGSRITQSRCMPQLLAYNIKLYIHIRQQRKTVTLIVIVPRQHVTRLLSARHRLHDSLKWTWPAFEQIQTQLKLRVYFNKPITLILDAVVHRFELRHLHTVASLNFSCCFCVGNFRMQIDCIPHFPVVGYQSAGCCWILSAGVPAICLMGLDRHREQNVGPQISDAPSVMGWWH